MKKLTQLILALTLLCPLFPVTCPLSYAAVPHLINYQGRLTDSGGTPLNGSYSLTFRIYDAEAAGNLLWQETHSAVVIQKGIFSIMLGSVADLNLPFDKPYFLEIKVNNEVMSPRQQLTSAGYAIRAENVEIAEKIKADSSDTSPGYLSDKVDNSTIKLNTSTHKIYASHGSQMFTSSGTFTAPTGVTKVYITMVAGGGGGGYGTGGGACCNQCSGGGGGGGESILKQPVTVVAGNNYAVTVGSAGVGGIGINCTAATAGTNSVFVGASETITAVGGGAGSTAGYPGPSVGGAGGGVSKDGSGTTVGGKGIKGGNGATINGSGDGGGGGGSMFGNGGAGVAFCCGSGASATDFGGGGGGGTKNAAYNGGNGAPGFVLVEW